ncbi:MULTISPECIES: hypothetical protein [unclassified Lysobacter]|uniref:hypothetical protein n=1 Tax=unclassified Lysobacter TaxID=2635362 RepID=UPI001BE94993|nr:MULTISPECIES: hypothetical protein [unclassified Lysobacter]MBT2748607.1 hypothetical protein [Lysobacter sp. ISL-42]MBT2751542.1 hypothetical protein [Lysobacter sp. ISL-50]MBT2775736.1 hypothetical protein [Lysobacter sp. ISL-54]MBT2782299.1 hypothetical protein [Lysobacter sp. ISL-52]
MFNTSKLFLLALALIPVSPASAQADAALPGNVYFAREEKSLTIPITYGWTTPPQRKVIYSLGPLNYYYSTQTRSLVEEVRMQVGLTKRCAGTVRLGYYVVRAFSPTSTEGTFVTRYAVVDLPHRPRDVSDYPLEPDEAINHSIQQQGLHPLGIGGSTLTKVYYNVVMFANTYDDSCLGQTLQVKGNDSHDYHGELSLHILYGNNLR